MFLLPSGCHSTKENLAKDDFITTQILVHVNEDRPMLESLTIAVLQKVAENTMGRERPHC